MGCFWFYCVQVKETCHKIYGFLEFVLSSSKWEREQLSQFWLILLLLSVSFTSNWAKKKSRLVWCNSLGEMNCWYLPADNWVGGWHCKLSSLSRADMFWHFTSILLTFYFYPIWMRDEVLTTRVSCTGSEWKDDGRHGGCLFLLWWHTLWQHWVAWWWLTSSCMI